MDLNDLTRSQQVALVSLVEDLAMSDGTIAEGETKEIGKLTATLGESRYRELLEEANEEIPDKETLKQRLRAIRDPAARDIIFGLAMEEAMLGPSAKHEQWEMLEWLKAEWSITVEPQNRRPAEGGPRT